MKEKEKQIIILAGLGYGDESKGGITDYLTRLFSAHTIIRYNGGSQAGHNVLTPDGRAHTFSQFGSGMFIDSVNTYLSRFILVDPLAMFSEERHLKSLGVPDVFSRTAIDRKTVIITPFHQAVNRLKQILPDGGTRHQSCARGVKEAMEDSKNFVDKVLFAGDLTDKILTERKLRFLQSLQHDKIRELRADLPDTDIVREELGVLDDRHVIRYTSELYQLFAPLVKIVDESYLQQVLNKSGTVIFEGAQGVLLDTNYGFKPYTTTTDTTFNNAERLISEHNYPYQKRRIGILRAYGTRHGAGPFVTEDKELSTKFSDEGNLANLWQGDFRLGYFDLVAAKYALEVCCGADLLALTHLDRLKDIKEWKICNKYKLGEFTKLADDYFKMNEGLIERIKLTRPARSDHQTQLTEFLESCRPDYIIPAEFGNYQKFLSFLQQQLQTPISILSTGQTANDKEWREYD